MWLGSQDIFLKGQQSPDVVYKEEMTKLAERSTTPLCDDVEHEGESQGSLIIAFFSLALHLGPLNLVGVFPIQCFANWLHFDFFGSSAPCSDAGLVKLLLL